MHLVDPIKVHVSYTCVRVVCACVCVCVCACVRVCVCDVHIIICYLTYRLCMDFVISVAT